MRNVEEDVLNFGASFFPSLTLYFGYAIIVKNCEGKEMSYA